MILNFAFTDTPTNILYNPPDDWSLSLVPGAGRNTGVRIEVDKRNNYTFIRFSGAGAQTATLSLGARLDNVDEGGTTGLSVALPTRDFILNFAILDTNLGGQLIASSTESGFTVTARDVTAAGEVSLAAVAGSRTTAQGVPVYPEAGGGAGREAFFDVTVSPAPASDLDVCVAVSEAGAARLDAAQSGVRRVTVPGDGATPGVARVGVGWRDTVLDDLDSAVTMRVLTPDSAGCAGAGAYFVANAAAGTFYIEDDDATLVSLARVGGTGALYEGESATLSVTLGRALRAGEVVDVPLIVAGTGVTPEDVALLMEGSDIGATLRDGVTTLTPVLRFAGAGAQAARLRLETQRDLVVEGETVRVGLGGASSFRAGRMRTNVNGGAGPDPAQNSVALEIRDDPVAVTLRPGQDRVMTEGVASDMATVIVELSRSLRAGDVVEVPLLEQFAGIGQGYNVARTASGTGVSLVDGLRNPTRAAAASQASYTVRFVGAGSRVAVLTYRLIPGGFDRDDDEGRLVVAFDEEKRTDDALNTNLATAVGPGANTATLVVRDRLGSQRITLSGVPGGNLEEGATKELVLTAEPALDLGETVSFALTVSGDAVAGTDYRLVGRTNSAVIWPETLEAGQPVVTLTGSAGAVIVFQALTDLEAEGNESVKITLAPVAGSRGVTLAGGVDFRIVNTAVPDAPVVAFTSPASTLREGVTGVVRPRVDGTNLLAATDVTYMVSAAPGALGGSDVETNFPLSGTRTISMLREADHLFTAAMAQEHDDTVDEPSERITLALLPGSGYRVGATGVHVITILDDDPTPVTLRATPGARLVEGDTGSVVEIRVDLGRARRRRM